MSVPLVAATTDTAAPQRPSPPAPADRDGGGDFAAALAAATAQAETAEATAGPAGGTGTWDPAGGTGTQDPTQLGSVSLGEMVAAYAVATGLGAPPPSPLAPGGAGAPPVDGVQAAAVAGGVGSATGHPALQAGEAYLGVPYLWGGTDPDTGFDCSGFVQRAFADIGVDLPRVSIDQSRAGQPVASMSEARPGDLVFWYGEGSRPNHIGIYAGDGEMLEAPSAGEVVRYREITREPHEIRRVT